MSCYNSVRMEQTQGCPHRALLRPLSSQPFLFPTATCGTNLWLLSSSGTIQHWFGSFCSHFRPTMSSQNHQNYSIVSPTWRLLSTTWWICSSDLLHLLFSVLLFKTLQCGPGGCEPLLLRADGGETCALLPEDAKPAWQQSPLPGHAETRMNGV